METIFIYVFLFFVVVGIMLSVWNDWKAEKRRQAEFEQLKALEVSRQAPADQTANNTIGTRDLFLDTLTKIGCQYHLGEGEDERIYFAYQGEHFFAEASNEAKFLHLWDTHWEHVELEDIDELSRLRKAINYSNLNMSVTTVYTIDEEEKTMDVHCKMTTVFTPEIPALDEFLRVVLDNFFRTHHMVTKEMNKLRVKEESVN
ncbi:MAG: hypothetical protein J6T82_06970 [Bacteroidaceae bacterium]|nr:hypothetical protein [Bacteroidaceae bacterium]